LSMCRQRAVLALSRLLLQTGTSTPNSVRARRLGATGHLRGEDISCGTGAQPTGEPERLNVRGTRSHLSPGTTTTISSGSARRKPAATAGDLTGGAWHHSGAPRLRVG